MSKTLMTSVLIQRGGSAKLHAFVLASRYFKFPRSGYKNVTNFTLCSICDNCEGSSSCSVSSSLQHTPTTTPPQRCNYS